MEDIEDKKNSDGFKSFADIFKSRTPAKKAPAYPWQYLALTIVNELSVPNFKRSSVFKVCRDLPENTIKIALNDTKELCKSGAKWKYFFKIIEGIKTKK